MHDSVFFKLKQAHPIQLHHVHRASLSWGGSSLVWDKSPRTSVTQIILNDSHILINTGNSAAHVISSILTLFVHLSHISPPTRLPWGVVEKPLILSLSEKRLPKRQWLHTTLRGAILSLPLIWLAAGNRIRIRGSGTTNY